MRISKAFFFVFTFLGLSIIAIFWGCQQGTSPTPPFFNVWSVDSIYSTSVSDNPLMVIGGDMNVICANITGLDEKDNTILLPTNESVYFTAVIGTLTTTGMDYDTMFVDYESNPYTPGTACIEFYIPANAQSLTMKVSVVGYDTYSRTQNFDVLDTNTANILYLYLEDNEVTVGGGQIGVAVLVQDQYGQPVADEMVCFTSLDSTHGVMVDSCMFSNSAGMCSTYFVIGTVEGVDTICAEDREGSYVCAEIIVSAAEAYEGIIDIDDYHIYRCGSGLNDRTEITLNLYDRYSNPVMNGTAVIFSIDTFTHMDSCSIEPIDSCYPCPKLDPAHDSLGLFYSDTVYTIDGAASVNLKSGFLPGVLQIRADVLDGSGTIVWTPMINISSGQPHYVSLSARIPGSDIWEAGDPNLNFYSAPIDYAMWGNCTQDSMPLEIMAIVSDEFSNPIPNVSVWFTATSGVVGGWPGSPTIAVTTDSTGIGNSYWFSSDRREFDSCFVMVKAYSSEISVADSLYFYLRYGDGEMCCDPCNLVEITQAYADPETVSGNGTDSIDIWAKVEYSSLPLTNYPVRFHTGQGWLTSLEDTTREDGYARVYLSAINPSGELLCDTVMVIAGNNCDTAYIPFYIAPAAVALNLTLVADDYNPNVGGQEVQLIGTIQDASGSPVTVPLPVVWQITDSIGGTSPDYGDFVSFDTYSDTLGIFEAVFRTGNVAGLFTVAAIIAGSGTTSVNLNILPGIIYLSADRYTLTVGGEISHLSGSIRNYLGEPITSPTAINWSALVLPDSTPATPEYGYLDSLSYASDTLGEFSGVFISSTSIGELLIIAEAVDIGMDTVKITVTSGTPASIDMSVSPSIDTVGSVTPDTVYGCVVDAYGNPVAYEGIINLWLAYSALGDTCYPCQYGSLEPTAAIPDSNGCFTALFSPGVLAGTVYIHALADSAHGIASVTLLAQTARAESIWVANNHIRTCGHAPYQTTIESYVFDQFGNPVADMTPVMFVIDTFSYMDACTTWDDSCLSACPRLIPSHTVLGPLYSDTLYTVDGMALTTLKAGAYSGVARVASYILDGSGEVAFSEMINISSGEIGNITISARLRSSTDTLTGNPCVLVAPFTCEYCSWTYDWWSGNPDLDGYASQINMQDGWVMDGDTCNALWIQVRIAVSDSFGNPIPEATVHFSCDEGVIGGYPYGLVDTTALTDANGLAYTYWYASDPRIDGQVWLKVYSADRSIGDSIWFYLLDTLGIPPYDTVEQEVIYVYPDTVFGDGLSTIDIQCRVMRNGNPVPNYPVYFHADSGMISSPVMTNSIGYANTIYYSALNHTPGFIASDRITMTAGVDTQYFNVYLLPVDPIIPYVEYLLMQIQPGNIAVGDTASIIGRVFDGRGDPVRLPIPVLFTLLQDGAPPPLGMGFISPSYTYTNTNPDSCGFFDAVFRSGTQAGDLWLIANAIEGEDTARDSLKIHITGSSPQYVEVTAGILFLEADGRSSTSITVNVTDIYGNPCEGATVNLSSTLGQINPQIIITDEDGYATTILTSGTITGTCRITAECDGYVGVEDVEFVDAAVHFIILTVEPSQLSADGVSEAVVSASIRDQYGQPIVDGTIVSFRCLDLTHTPVGAIDTIGVTIGGNVSVSLQSPTIACNAWVYASAMGYVESVFVQFESGEIYTITITAEPETIIADGLSQTVITATAIDEYGNSVGIGSRIGFSTTLGNLLFDHAYTNSSGQAQNILTSVRETGPAQVTASSGDAEDVVVVQFAPIVAHSIVVMSDSVSLTANGISTATITAIVFDSLGGAVPNGSPVSFSTDLGILIPAFDYTTDGQAEVTLRAPTSPGIATVIADAGDGVVGTTYVDIISGNPGEIVMTATPNILPADGDTTAIVSGTVYDMNDNPVDAGHEVVLISNMGQIDSITYTNASGEFSVIFRAGITAGTALIGASSGSANGQTYIDLIPTDVGLIYVTVDPNEIIANGSSQAQITGRVTNVLGNPITDGTPVRLEIHCSDTTGCDGFGEIIPITVPTDSGDFAATFIAGTRVGRVWIFASVDTVIDSTAMDLIPGDVDSIDVTVNPSMIPADSFSHSSIIAGLYDSYGNPLGSGTTVNFATTSGAIFPTITTTNSSGIAISNLTSSRTPGVARITVSAGTVIGEDTVVFTESGAGLVIVTIEPVQITADGVSSAMITAQITDTLGNPISDGIPVLFYEIVDTAAGDDTLGVLVPSIAYTSDGIATIQFRARTGKGLATIRACIDSLHCGEGAVELIAGPADSIYLTASDSTLPADGVRFTEISAIAFDRYGNTVETGNMVGFNTTSGQLDPTSSPTNSGGEARTILTSATEPGIAWVTAQLDAGYATIPIEFGMAEPVFIAVSAIPRRIIADGVSTSSITARLINAVGEPVVEGTMISFHAFDSLGNQFGDIDTLATTTAGQATVTLYAPTITGLAYVSATYAGTTDTLADTTTVTYTPGSPAEIEILVTPDTLYANDSLTASISIVVVDVFGNPVDPGKAVSISVDIGEVFPVTAYTGDTIECTYYPGSVAGRATVTANCEGITDQASIELLTQTITFMFVFSDSSSIVADGISTTLIHVLANDGMGHAVADNTPIYLTTTAGLVTPAIAYTVGGEGIVTLRSGTVAPETAMVVATAGTIGDTVLVPFRPGPPASIEIIPDSSTLYADGEDTTTVRAYIQDIQGNWISEGVAVYFSTSLGTIDTMTLTNAIAETTGYAITRFRAGIIPGSALVSATCGEAFTQCIIDLIPTDIGNVYLSVEPNQIVANARDEAVISGRVTNTLGNPITDDTPVRLEFFCLDTLGCENYGEVVPVTVHTDSGDFEAAFAAGTKTGRIWIVATVDTIADTVFLDLVPDEPDSIALSVTPNAIPADSFTTANVEAELYDRFGNPVGSAVSVSFSTTLGEIFPVSTTTNSSGHSNVTLRSGRQTGIARVRAVSGTAIGEDTVIFTQTGIGQVIVTIDSAQIIANGINTTSISAHVSDTLGNPVSDGMPVLFAQIVDTAAGGDTLGLLVPSIGFTDSGSASIFFRTGTQVGMATIKACVDSIHCGSGYIDLIPGPPDSISLEPADTIMPANGVSITTVSALVYDRYQNSVQSGVSVAFNTTLGQITPLSAPTNSSGEAMAMLTSSMSPGLAWLTAQAEDAYATAMVNFGMTPPVFMSIRAEPRRIEADGLSISRITAHLINSVGDPVVDGTMIFFHSVDGAGIPFGDIDTIATTMGGDASVDLIAETTMGVAYVSATWFPDTTISTDTLSDTVTVTFTPGVPAAIQVTATPGTLYANDTLTARVTIVVSDVFGNMVDPGNTVSISVDNGDIFPTSGYTGDTIVCMYYPGSIAGRAVIEANCTGIIGTAIIELLTQQIANLDVYADSAFLIADGLSTTQIHILAQDSLGHPVADNTPVYLTSTSGAVFPGVLYTVDGVAAATLRSGTVAPDTAMVRATAGSVSDTVLVVIKPGPPAIINATPDSTLLFANGEDTTMVRAYITDIQGNWVEQGQMVTFVTNLGSIDSFDITHAVSGTTGYAEAMFRAGIVPGTALITIQCGDAISLARVILEPTNVGEFALFANPNILVADGHDTSAITGFVRNTLGNPITDGTQVRFRVSPDTLGFVSPVSAYTDSGNFAVTYTTGIVAESVWVVMDVAGFTDSVAIEQIPGIPHSIVLTPMIGAILADSASVDTIAVVVSDRYGNRVHGGITVDFSTTLGEVYPTSNETNSAGSTYVFLRSGFEIGAARVVARIDSARGECSISILPTTPYTVSLTVNPHTLMADGFSEAALVATVLDTLGHPIYDGTPVNFWLIDTLYGVIIPGISYTLSGDATSTFRAAVQKGYATIHAETDSLHFDEVTLTLTAGPPALCTLTVASDTLYANSMDQTDATVRVYDEWGNPVDAGLSVDFNATLGQILVNPLLTDENGTATTVLQTGSVPGNCQVSAQCGGVYDVTNVTFIPSTIQTIILSCDPPELTADGISSSAILAQVFDASGSQVTDNTKIYFWAIPDTLGTVISPRFTSGGQAVTSLIAGNTVGGGEIWVFAGDDTFAAATVVDSVKIGLIPGAPAYMNVWADSSDTAGIHPDSLYANGTDGVWIFAQIFDAYGNHIQGGQTASFSTTMGTFTPTSSMTDTSGIARAFLQSGLMTGIATVTVTSDNAMGFKGIEMVQTLVEGILLNADKTILTADGIDYSTVTATVIAPGGTPVSDGTVVHFEAESTWVHILPADAYTTDGVATTIVRADTSAIPTVRFFAFVAGSDTSSLNFRVDPGEPATMIITPAPADSDSIAADGSSNIEVHVYVYDQYSNPIRAGTTIRFQTTLGTISETNFTDLAGHSSALLTAGTVTGNAVITVQCSAIEGFTQVSFFELLADEIVLTINPIQMIADGVSEAAVIARAYDSLGFPVSDGTRIEFAHDTTVSDFEPGLVAPHIAFTEGGMVSVTLTAPPYTGNDRITASVMGAASIADSFNVKYLPGPPAVIEFIDTFIVIGTDTFTLDSLMADGRHYEVRVRVTDAYGNPVEVGTAVSFSTTLGEIQSPAVVSDTAGNALTFISSHETGPGVMTAISGDAVSSNPVNFREVEGNLMRVTYNPRIITADGLSQVSITATVLDTSGGVFVPVSDGVPVQFSNLGPQTAFLSASLAFTENGQATVSLVSGVTAGSTFVAILGPINGPDTLADTIMVTLTPGPPAIVEFVQYPASLLANATDTGAVWIRVIDQYNNGVQPGIPVSFSTNLGDITSSSVTQDLAANPDSTGFAFGILTASESPGIATLSASCQGAVGYATVSMQELTPDSIILTINPRNVIADGVSTSELTAVVFDTTGVPIPVPVSDGTIVHFFANRGITQPVIAYTTDGFATSSFIAPVTLLPETVVVSAVAGTISVVDTIILQPGPPAIINVISAPTVLTANGIDSDTIRIAVTDEYDNPVGPGLPVSFSTELGIITETNYTDANSESWAVLTTEYISGWTTVNFSCGDASSSILVQFVPSAVGDIILSVNPIRLVADGLSTATINIAVLDTGGHPIADGTPVLLKMLQGYGIIDPPMVTTTDGQASAVLTSFIDVGFDTLVAQCDTSDSAIIEFIAGPPANVTVWTDTIDSPSIATLLSDGLDTTTVYAVVTDAVGHSVEAGLLVNYTVNPSTMGSVWPSGITDANGISTTKFTAGTVPGMISIQATSSSASGSGVIELNPAGLERIDLFVTSHYLPADGVSTTNVTAMVFDSLDIPAPNGTGVHFTYTDSSVEATIYPGYTQTTDGIAQVQLISPTSIGPCTVYAYVDTGASDSIVSNLEVIYFEGGEPRIITFNKALVSLLADGNSADSTCTLWVNDLYGNEVTHTPVNLSLDLGFITPAIVVTDSLGCAQFTVLAPRHAGTGIITATSGAASGYLNAKYSATPVGSITLYANPSTLPADGLSQSEIRAVVLDTAGGPVSDGMSVIFRTTQGYITPFDTTVMGQAYSYLTAIDTAQTVTVWARVDTDSVSVDVEFTSGSPDTIYVEFNPDTGTVGSGILGTVSGSIKDALGNPVGNGTLMHLWLSDSLKGTLGDTVLTTGVGAVCDSFTTTFTPGNKAGIVWVYAEASGATGSNFMLLKPEIAHTESIDVDRSHIFVRGAGGIDQAILSAFIYDRYGNPVMDSTQVIFWCTNYPGGSDTDEQPSIEPEHPVLGQLYSDTVYTLNGEANITVRSGKSSGVVLVRSSVLDGSGIVSEAPRISISSGLPYNVSVSAEECNVAGWLVDGISNRITAIVSDSMDNPCPNVAVYFTCDEGIVTGSSVTDSVGFALATWYSADPRGVAGDTAGGTGDIQIQARTVGDSSSVCGSDTGWACDSSYFYNSGPGATMTISTASEIDADGESIADVVVHVCDINWNPIVDESSISLDVDRGTITSPIMTYNECYGTRADAVYTSATVDLDLYPSDPQVSDANITGEVGFAVSATSIDLMGTVCSNSNSEMVSPGAWSGGSTYPVSVIVKDIWGNPIAGESVDLSASYSAVAATPQITNTAGTALFTVNTPAPDTLDHTDYIAATFDECMVTAEVTIRAGRMFTPAGETDSTETIEEPVVEPIGERKIEEFDIPDTTLFDDNSPVIRERETINQTE